MLKPTQLFPQGHATGKAFYNRDSERKKLKDSLLNHEHTVISAPRRYGKSSLIKQSLFETKLPGRRIDLLPATNLDDIHTAVKNSVSELINELSPKTKKAKEKLIESISKLHPKLTLRLLGQQLEINIPQPSESGLIDLLVGLDTAAKKVSKIVVFCFDEFQQISLLKNYHSIEASIRHAVESSSNVVYIFSGSNRRLLNKMFSSKDRPLYHLCDLIVLDRIRKETYLEILIARANERWKTSINTSAIEEILSLTKCHPYYVNALCRHLYKEKNPPHISSVQETWLKYVGTQTHWIRDDLSRLSSNQKNLVNIFAKNSFTTEPYSAEFSDKAKLGISSIKKSLDILLRDDVLFQDKSGAYRILDPAIETYLQQLPYFLKDDDLS